MVYKNTLEHGQTTKQQLLNIEYTERYGAEFFLAGGG